MNVFDLSAKLTLDTSEYERNLSAAGERTQGFGDKLKSGLGTAAKIGAAAVTAAAGAIVAITKNAVQNYAEYEQLVGGVETLFKDSADVVQQYAANAYKTAGLSANEYMETVTSFSASLLQSLGGDTEQAARMADLAITDMSDNANKMGTDMASIQNAYQGFAKQNYTMLDNLKLGYGGTKEEMERLINDANKLRAAHGEAADLTIDSYADVVAAIHEVQTEMGITGTTAKEASSTIQGSIAATKSAWQNLLTGLADPSADIGGLFDNLVESAGTAFDNLLPVIGQAIGSIGKLIAEGIPKIQKRLPELIKTLVPTLIQAAISLVAQLVANLPQVLAGLFEAIPVILDSIFQGFAPIVEGLGDIFRQAWQAVKDVFAPIGEWFAQRKEDVQNAFASVGAWFSDKFTAAKDAVHAVWEGIGNWFGDRWSDISNAFQTADAWFDEKFTAAKDAVHTAWSAIGGWFSDRWSDITGAFSDADGWFSTKFTAASDAVHSAWSGIGTWFSDKWTEIKGVFGDAWSAFTSIGRDLLMGLWNGINDKIEWLKSKVLGVVDRIKSWFTGKDGFDEHSPSRWAADVFRLVMEGGARGLSAALPGLMREVNNVTGNIKDAFDFDSATIGTDFGSYGFAPQIELAPSGQPGAYNVVNNINTNVYAAPGQDAEEIARKVERRIAQNILSREAVWA